MRICINRELRLSECKPHKHKSYGGEEGGSKQKKPKTVKPASCLCSTAVFHAGYLLLPPTVQISPLASVNFCFNKTIQKHAKRSQI